MEQKLWETNAYQNGFLTNFHFYYTKSTDLSLFLPILEMTEKKIVLERKLTLIGG